MLQPEVSLSSSSRDKLILYYFEANDVVRSMRLRGSWWAHSPEQARFWLMSQGYSDILVRPMPTDQSHLKVGADALALFYRQLAVMFRAGVPLTDALRLTSYSEDRNLCGVCLSLGEQIAMGYSLSQSMRAFPSVFDTVVVGLIAASEGSGRLPQTLARLADAQERQYRLRRTVIGALTYPALIGVATLGLTVLFFAYIFPINRELFSSLHVELPWINKVLYRLFDMVGSPLFPVALMIAAGAIASFFRSPHQRMRARQRLEDTVMLVPAFERFITKSRALRMLEILGLLLDGGGTLDKALCFMIAATPDERGRKVIQSVRLRIMEGDEFALALKETEYFPPLVCSLLDVGQETGRMVEMARRGAEICEEDVRHALDVATTLLEPLLLGVAGLMAGVAVVSSVMPMLTLLTRL